MWYRCEECRNMFESGEQTVVKGYKCCPACKSPYYKELTLCRGCKSRYTENECCDVCLSRIRNKGIQE